MAMGAKELIKKAKIKIAASLFGYYAVVFEKAF